MPASPGAESVSGPAASAARFREELPYRLRQQSLPGEFGRSALQSRDIARILQRATELCAQGLDAPFAKVLEYMPDEIRLLVRAGVGWSPGTTGKRVARHRRRIARRLFLAALITLAVAIYTDARMTRCEAKSFAAVVGLCKVTPR